jgi:hypothetical protein
MWMKLSPRALQTRAMPCAALIVAVLLLASCGGGEVERPGAGPGSPASAKPRHVALPRGVTANLPVGWRLFRKPITGVTYPAQVLAAASYPARLGKRPPSCVPGHVLKQRPPRRCARRGDRVHAPTQPPTAPAPKTVSPAEAQLRHLRVHGVGLQPFLPRQSPPPSGLRHARPRSRRSEDPSAGNCVA